MTMTTTMTTTTTTTTTTTMTPSTTTTTTAAAAVAAATTAASATATACDGDAWLTGWGDHDHALGRKRQVSAVRRGLGKDKKGKRKKAQGHQGSLFKVSSPRVFRRPQLTSFMHVAVGAMKPTRFSVGTSFAVGQVHPASPGWSCILRAKKACSPALVRAQTAV